MRVDRATQQIEYERYEKNLFSITVHFTAHILIPALYLFTQAKKRHSN